MCQILSCLITCWLGAVCALHNAFLLWSFLVVECFCSTLLFDHFCCILFLMCASFVCTSSVMHCVICHLASIFVAIHFCVMYYFCHVVFLYTAFA